MSGLPKKLVIASGNPGKLREFRNLLSGLGIEVFPQSDFNVKEAAETGLTFVENAIIKARNASEQTGLPALADDSGLEVDALNGAPGIYSARFAGPGASDEQNNQKLLNEIHDAPDEKRGACYRCVIVLLKHAQDPMPVICEGSWAGTLISNPRGDGGFGYDPLFWVTEKNCTAAELDPAEKNRISHRGLAIDALYRHFSG